MTNTSTITYITETTMTLSYKCSATLLLHKNMLDDLKCSPNIFLQLGKTKLCTVKPICATTYKAAIMLTANFQDLSFLQITCPIIDFQY